MKPCSTRSPERRILILYLAFTGLLILAAVLGLLLGGTRLSVGELLDALLEGDPSAPAARIFWYVRFPRTLACLLCGAALAVSGAVIQSVLANRLASPSIIGVNAGAGLAVTLCGACGLLGGWRVSLFSFLGALLTVLLVSLGARKWGASRGTVIFIGVALNSLLGAITDTVITLKPEVGILHNAFRVGDFSAVTYKGLIPAAVLILFASAVLLTLTGELSLLVLGEDTARSLGMRTSLMRVLFLALAAVLAGSAVSIAGLLSFVGLLVPHAVRRLTGGESRHLLPLSFLLGGGFVTLCDTLSRCLFAPYEISVGILLAFLGAPFFLFLLIKGKGGHADA